MDEQEWPENATVLVVDDDRVITSTLTLGLMQHGLRVLAANSAENARQCIQRESLDLVIIDSKMPEESGIKLADWIRSEHSELPYIFLSAYADSATVAEAIGHGALTYMVKPVQVPQLLPVIYAAITRAREIFRLRSCTDRLTVAVDSNRDISVAIGLLMAKFGLTREEAFEQMRKYCRNEGRRMRDVAVHLIEADEILTVAGRRDGGMFYKTMNYGLV